MEAAKIVSAVLKLWFLGMICGAIYFLWRERAAPPLASQVEAAEKITHTDVEVTVGAIRKMTLHESIVGFGNIAAAPGAEARVTVDWPAVVSEVKCTEGQHVEKGDTLFVAQSAKNGMVTSPISGTIVALDIHPGEVALPTKTAVDVVNLDRLVAAMGIPASEASKGLVGQSASVDIPPLKIDSKVERVDAATDPGTNLVGVDITLPPGSGVRPGEFARASIALAEQKDCLAVPADAIVRDALDRPYIGIVSDDRKQALLKPVVPGLRDGDWVEVTGDGLAENETIVISGAYALQYRSDIRITNP